MRGPEHAVSRDEEQTTAVRMRGITLRSILIGLVLTIVHTVWVIYEEEALLHINAPTIMIPVQTVIGLLFLILISNSVLKKIRPSWMFSPAEMMVIFVMTTFAAIVVSSKFLVYLFPSLLWPSYVPADFEGYNKFTQFLPTYFIPQNKDVIHDFFVGGHQFWYFFKPEIFKHWVGPMAFWGIFIFLLLWTPLCMSSVLRRQWVDSEKIQFPIVDLPLMMVKENTVTSLFSNKLLLGGFSVTFAILSLNYLSSLYPSIPHIPMAETDIAAKLFVTPPFTSVGPMLTVWWPYAIGLCYLIPLDVSFSCWFFYFLFRILIVLTTAVGWRTADPGLSSAQFPYFEHLSEGAWLGMFMVVMWSARGFLGQIRRMLRSNEPIPGEENEPISYRAAVYGAIAGFALLVLIAVVSGMRVHIALIAFTLYFLAIVVMTRMYAQIALPLFCMAFFSFTSWTTSFTGLSGMTGRDSTILTSFYWFDRTYETLPMGHQMESMVFADRLNQSKRLMFRVVLISMIVGIIVGMLTLLQLYYDRGASSASMSADPVWFGSAAWGRLKAWSAGPQSVQFATILKMGVSMVIVILLAVARNTWFGFPLHPIGYLFASSFALEWGMWNIIFVTWLIKWLVVKYGGLHLYRKSLPLFFGLALGDAVAHLAWGIAMGLIGAKGATPY